MYGNWKCGTDNRMFVVDLTETHPNITGKMVQDRLDENGKNEAV